MNKGKTEFQTFLAEEVNKVQGTYYPVRAGTLRRWLIKKAPIRKLHPNPGDEFCFPDIGPNYEIISQYEKDYARIINNEVDPLLMKGGVTEPIMVEKTHPDGYMILNGHHRWAAARRVGVKKLNIKIVDLTQEQDLLKMLHSAKGSKRVTMDLDEVVFRPNIDPYLEKPLPFPANINYKERIRLGIPALMHDLIAKGYDIWVYSSEYYSFPHLMQYFKHYHIHLTGIVTGTARKTPHGADFQKKMEKMAASQYASTLHIDNDSMLQTFRDSKEYEEYPIVADDATWAQEARRLVRELK